MALQELLLSLIWWICICLNSKSMIFSCFCFNFSSIQAAGRSLSLPADWYRYYGWLLCISGDWVLTLYWWKVIRIWWQAIAANQVKCFSYGRRSHLFFNLRQLPTRLTVSCAVRPRLLSYDDVSIILLQENYIVEVLFLILQFAFFVFHCW